MENAPIRISLDGARWDPYQQKVLEWGMAALTGGPALHQEVISADKERCKDHKESLAWFEAEGFRTLTSSGLEQTFAKGSSIIRVQPNYSTFAVAGTDSVEVAETRAQLVARFGEQKLNNTIYLLAETNDDYNLSVLCDAPETNLIEDNYDPKVVAKFKHMSQEIVAKEPQGRLGILTGHPGTGKTYLARALMNTNAPNADFILVTPEQAVRLAGSAHKYMRLRARRKNRFSVFIMEDADKAVSPRKGENMSAIQSILNFGDGIMGVAMDVRVLITSNVRSPEIDPALMRPGRLIEHIEVGALSTKQAASVYQRLTSGSKTYKTTVSLAQVYADAKEYQRSTDQATAAE